MKSAPQYEQFIKLFEQNLGIILKIARSYTRTAHDSEDLVNDISYAMWKAFPRFRAQSKVSTWIYRIALNTAMNYRRNQGRSHEFIREAVELPSFEVPDRRDDNPLVELLYDCIDELDSFNKAIILLFLDGYDHAEIAEVTGISRTNVGTRISRIRTKLKVIADNKQK